MIQATFDPSKSLNLYLRIGMDGGKTFVFSDQNGNPYDISGYTFEMVIYYRVGGSVFLTWTESDQLDKPNDYSLSVTITDTIANLFQPREYFYILKRTDTNSLVRTWFNGVMRAHNGEFDGIRQQSQFNSIDMVNVQIFDSSSFDSSSLNGTLFTKRVTLTPSDILNSFSSPVTIVSAVINKIIVPIYFAHKCDFNSAAYTGNVTTNYKINGNTVSQNHDISFSSDKFRVIQNALASLNTDLTNLTNQPLVMTSDVGNPSSGNSNIEVFVVYFLV